MNGKIAEQIEAVNCFLLARHPDGFHRRVAIRKFLQNICARHIELGLGDSNLVKELCSGDDARYRQRLSEILLANEMLDVGLPLIPSREGPDFLVEIDGRRIWIEVICPQPTGIPHGAAVPAYSFLDPSFGAVSAIWATDIDESWVIGNMKPMAVIHNPIAANPIPSGLLPAYDEFIATPDGDEYVLERRDGQLIQRS